MPNCKYFNKKEEIEINGTRLILLNTPVKDGRLGYNINNKIVGKIDNEQLPREKI